MPLKTLLDGDFNKYLQEERNHDRCLWLFLHIPKTAGSSFGSELARYLRPKQNIEIDYSRIAQLQVEGDPFRFLMREAVQEFIANTRVDPHRLAMGHLVSSDARMISSQVEHVKLVSMLRHPVDRFVSDFRYQRTPGHPLFRDFIEKFPTIEDYLDSGETDNLMARTLCEGPLDVRELIDHIERNFSFVGFQEDYALHFSLMMRLLGTKGRPTYFERKTEDCRDNMVNVTDRLYQRIANQSSIDMEFHAHFKRRFEEIRIPLLAYLRESG